MTLRDRNSKAVKGFSFVYGSDGDQIFAPVVKYSTMRTLLSFGVSRSMQTEHLDIQTAFLHGEIEIELMTETATRVYG